MPDVTMFTAQARAEFAAGMVAAFEKPVPAEMEQFVTTIGSNAKVETHTYLSAIPRLKRFFGYEEGSRLEPKEYTVPNYQYRAGPVRARIQDINDDQTGTYLSAIQRLPERARKDIGHEILEHLANGTTNLCFDGTAFFANSHTFGSGDNLDTANYASNDGVTHKVIGLITDNSSVRPVIFQDRESLSGLKDDAGSERSEKTLEIEYWADARFGLAYGLWWDAYHVTITDTPTVEECYTLVEQIINGFRAFTLPKGADEDDALYVHEGWMPSQSNFVLLCNLKLGAILQRAMTVSQYVASTGNVDNVYKDVAKVIPTSALGA